MLLMLLRTQLMSETSTTLALVLLRQVMLTMSRLLWWRSVPIRSLVLLVPESVMSAVEVMVIGMTPVNVQL